MRRWMVRCVGVFAVAFAFAVCAEEVHLARNEKAAEQSVAALILTEVYQKIGITPIIQPLPGARANIMTLAGDKDGEVARIATYAVNNPSLIKVEPGYYYLVSTAFAKSDKNIVIKSRDDLKQYRVGIVRGIAHAKVASEGVAAVEEVGTYQQMFQMLDAGRIDVAIDAGINGAYMIKKLGLSGVKPVGELARLELFHMLAPKSSLLAPKIAASLKALKSSGDLDRLVAKHERAFLTSGAEP